MIEPSFFLHVQHDQSALVSIDGSPVVRGDCCSTPYGRTGTIFLLKNKPYQISVGYIQRTGGTYYAALQWKCESGDCTSITGGIYDAFTFVQGSTSHGVSSSAYSSPRGGGVYVSSTAKVNVSGVATVQKNTVDGGNGGGFYFDDGSVGSRIDGALTLERNHPSIQFLANVAQQYTVALTGGLQKKIGGGLGGGIFSIAAQIGHTEDVINAGFQHNTPTGIHSERSSMFFKGPLSIYADPMIAEGFPFPVPMCPPGHFFPYNKPNPWKNLAGKTGTELCSSCTTGRWSTSAMAPNCNPIAPGKMLLNQKLVPCPKGSHCQAGAAHTCTSGTFSETPGNQECDSCAIGTFSTGGAVTCTPCMPGFLQTKPGQDHCDKPKAGKIALGGTNSIQVPDGWEIEGFVAKPCKEGTYGNTEEANKTFCNACPAGWSSYEGSLVCLPCAKGKFSPRPSMAQCTLCQPGTYQPQEFMGSTVCLKCPTGYNSNTNGSVLCSSLGYKTKESCNDDEFLNDIDVDPGQWHCHKCATGGSCKGAINATGIRVLFGWSACPTDLISLNKNGVPTFEPCLFGAACEGAANPMLFNKYVDAHNKSRLDPAKQDRNGSCATPYRHGSLMCAGCEAGHSHAGGGDGKCLMCPPIGTNLMWAIVGILFATAATVVFVHITIADAGSLDNADGAKNIGFSFIQVLVLLSTFPIAWPNIFIVLFHVGGAVTTMGRHLVNIKCMWPAPGYISEADVFYGMRLVWAVLPVLLPLSCVIVWYLFSCCVKIERLSEKMKTSVVGLLHLIWPVLCSETFALFSCRSVCGRTLLYIDIEEVCWEGSHLTYSLAVGLPMLLVWVLGIPIVAFLKVRRLDLKRGADGQLPNNPVWGILYSVYDGRVWWWESVVALRKIVIAAIGVFGASFHEMQVHTTSLLMVRNYYLCARSWL